MQEPPAAVCTAVAPLAKNTQNMWMLFNLGLPMKVTFHNTYQKYGQYFHE